MTPKTPGARPLVVGEEQVLWFRARRSLLAGAGAPNAVAAARGVLGAQSQQLGPSLWALALRTKSRPDAQRLRRELLEERKLVRTWGQRDTLHVYDPNDWSDVIAGSRDWGVSGRRNVMPSDALLAKALKKLDTAAEPVTRRMLFDLLPRAFVRQAAEAVGETGEPAERLAAARIIWRLAHEGHACIGHKSGAENTYAARSLWFPDLDWPEPDAPVANVRLTRRYFALHGPATPTDVAHFFGASVANAKTWVTALADELRPVECGARAGLAILKKDARTLASQPPTGVREWPVRLLPLWDTLLMAHADKSWTTPVEAERKQVWKKAAYVLPVVVARGRIVATWSHKERRKAAHVTVTPLSGWRSSKHAAGVRREAAAFARHLGLKSAVVD